MRLDGDFFSLLMVWTLPFCIAAVFPYEAIGFRASEVRNRRLQDGGSAIVSLSPAQVTASERAAKATWRKGAETGVWRPNLLVDTLPDAPHLPVMPIAVRSRMSLPPLVEVDVSPFLPSRRAGPPTRIVQDKEEEPPTFSRDELLKIN